MNKQARRATRKKRLIAYRLSLLKKQLPLPTAQQLPALQPYRPVVELDSDRFLAVIGDTDWHSDCSDGMCCLYRFNCSLLCVEFGIAVQVN